jgi:ComF family protein
MIDDTDSRNSAEAHYGLLLSKAQLWLNAGLDLVFPPRCAGCGRVDTVLCPRCQAEIDAIAYIPNLQTLPPLSGSAATGLHDGKLQQAVHALKYDNTPALARPLGDRLSECLIRLSWPIDIIVPVPLHTSRIKERGYNQAQVLGAHVAARHKIPLLPGALARWRLTTTQVGLTADQRRANVSGAFSANPALVAYQTLLLIDDVFTTGATLQACALAAMDGGAAAVYSLTVTTARV